jgi:hypothetical protein
MLSAGVLSWRENLFAHDGISSYTYQMFVR